MSITPPATILGLLLALTTCLSPAARAQNAPARRPNIILILADDLAFGELGCYGQRKIRTPRLDRLDAQGMRFNHFYSGSPVCAPSRCTLLTGLHTGHAFIRDNKEMGGWGPDEPEGQLPLPANTITFASILQAQGYATAAIGKWGLGGPGSTGAPGSQAGIGKLGIDFFYGYLCQRIAHNYYPTHLWRNDKKELLEGNEWFSAHQRLDVAPADAAAYARYRAAIYVPDLLLDEALRFIDANRARPFFLYYATPVPHAALQVPDESIEPYLAEAWDREPYLGQQDYLPHPHPRAAYAAMISRLDRDIGTILDHLDTLGLTGETIVMVTSDNGPTFTGGVDFEFFDSNGPLRGLKGSLYEGGIRVPLIVRWPGRIATDSQANHIGAFWDLMPTIGDLVDIAMPQGRDGVSFAATLLGRPYHEQIQHRYLYWEYQGAQSVRMDRWKAIWPAGSSDLDDIELYDLGANDYEGQDVSDDHPILMRDIARIMREGRTESAEFPLNRN